MINGIDIKILKEALNKEGVFKEHENKLIHNLTNVIQTKLEQRMKLQLAVHNLVFYISQFRPNVVYIGQAIPINSIAFLFSQSGTGKDTSINQIKRVFESSFDLIEDRRMQLNTIRANKLLEANINSKATLEDYMLRLPELNVGVSTDEGLILSIAEAQKISLGSLNINTNEFIADMSNRSQLLLPLLTTLAETYDLGNKQSKNLKDKSKEVKSLNNVFLNALFTSSFNLFDNTKIRYVISNEFKSRFARRASITFNNIKPILVTTNDLSEWLLQKKKANRVYLDSTQKLSDYFEDMTKHLLDATNNIVMLDDKAEEIYLIYQQYCLQLGQSLSSLENAMTSLNVTNRYFQALKLSGALALLDNDSGYIRKQHIVDAINIIEVINNDIEIFESELAKLEYEVLIDHCRELFNQQKSKVTLSLHVLTKYGFVKDSSQIPELLKQCNSKETEGMFISDKASNCISYEKLESTDTYTITYKKLDGISKDERSKFLGGQWKSISCDLEAICRLLKQDFAYTTFTFKDNIRNKENLIPKTNLLVLDIDKSSLSYEQLHEALKGSINHIIATTSNKDNKFKFRILLPLTSVFTIEPIIWKSLIKSIAKDYILDIDTDLLPQSQIFYSYKDSEVLYTFNKSNLDLKSYLINALSTTYNIKLSDKEKKNLLSNPRATFRYAFDMKEGARNLTFIRLVNHAYDLGMPFEEVTNLIDEVNSYIECSLTNEELNKHIYPHLRKKYGI